MGPPDARRLETGCDRDGSAPKGSKSRIRQAVVVKVAGLIDGVEIMNAMFQAWMEEGRPKYFAEGKAEGRAEGKAEGIAETFLKLARSKFRRVPKEQQAQVRAATLPQLDIWLNRILTATSLNEVFDGEVGEGTAGDKTPAKSQRR